MFNALFRRVRVIEALHRPTRALLGAVVLALGVSVCPSRDAMAQSPQEVSPDEVASTLDRVGLSPESLCASGVPASGVAAIVSSARTYLESHYQELRVADEDRMAATTEIERLQCAVQSGDDDATTLNLLENRRVEVQSVNARRDVLLGAFFSAAISSVPADRLIVLTRIGQNQRWKLPLQFSAANRLDEDWVVLRDALAAESFAFEKGEVLAQSVASVLATARASSDVAAAHAWLSTVLESVRQAWNIALVGR